MPSGRRWVGASAALANACTPRTHTHTHARAHTRTHPRACVAFRSEVGWGQRGVAVKLSAVGVVRWQTHARRSVRIFTAITFAI